MLSHKKRQREGKNWQENYTHEINTYLDQVENMKITAVLQVHNSLKHRGTCSLSEYVIKKGVIHALFGKCLTLYFQDYLKVPVLLVPNV